MAYKLAANYKRYKMDAGGYFDLSNNKTSMGMGISNSAAGIVDGAFSADQMGRKPIGASIASGALKGAGTGAAVGSVIPGVGTVIGAGVGAVVGGTVGWLKGKSQNAAAGTLAGKMNQQQQQATLRMSQAAYAQNPELANGYTNGSYYGMGGTLAQVYYSRPRFPYPNAEFAMGGQMETSDGVVVRPEDKVMTTGAKAKSRPLAENYLSRMTRAEGGSLTPLSQDSVAVNGPSHAEGGVQLPDQQAEVEGGESMKGNFVFSDRLGFADEHKRLERAIGNIQAKGAMTPEKVNAVRRMQGRVQTLALSQEYLKHILSGGQLPDPTQQQGQPQQQPSPQPPQS